MSGNEIVKDPLEPVGRDYSAFGEIDYGTQMALLRAERVMDKEFAGEYMAGVSYDNLPSLLKLSEEFCEHIENPISLAITGETTAACDAVHDFKHGLDHLNPHHNSAIVIE